MIGDDLPLPPVVEIAGEARGEIGVPALTASGDVRPLEDVEADMIRLALEHCRGRMTDVARALGIGRSTLYRKLREIGLDAAE